MTTRPPDAATLLELEPADLADLLASLDESERLAVVTGLPPERAARALIEMPAEAHPEATLAALGRERAAAIVGALADDDAADLLGELEPDAREGILAAVAHRGAVERLLRYDEETAGGRMTAQVVTVLDTDTAMQALEAIRRQADQVGDFYQVFVVDADRRLVGVLPLTDLVTSAPDRLVREFMADVDTAVAPEQDQEEVARLMARYNVPSVPVVDARGRLIGRVTFDDVIDVVEAETTEDLLQFGGVSGDEPLGAGWADAVRSRLPWMLLNLATALLAAAVVKAFQDSIARTAALAVWMPVIAGMGGNAGTQALAVTIRRIALGLIPPNRFGRAVGRELLVGCSNGLVIGVLVALLAAAIEADPRLGLVVFLAMVGNLVVAGFAGAFIPLVLERFRIDPAIASSVFVTTFTDVCGFTLLLGLAGLLLL